MSDPAQKLDPDKAPEPQQPRADVKPAAAKAEPQPLPPKLEEAALEPPRQADPAGDQKQPAKPKAKKQPAPKKAVVKAKPEPEAKAKPEPEAKAKPEPEAKAKPEPEAKAKPEPEAKAKPEPEAKAKPDSDDDDEADVPNDAAPTARLQPPLADHAAAARRLRIRRAWRLALRLALGVLLPTALAGTYYGFIASDLYESTSLFTIQSADGRSAVALDSLLGAIPASSPAARDTLAVRDYILSRDVLQRLDREHGFRAHYEQEKFDALSRLDAEDSFEAAYDYYLSRVQVDYDSTSGMLTLKVKAFSPDKAVEFTEAVLHYSEEMVNQLSERARSDQTKYAMSELKQAEQRLSSARQRVLELQGERAEFNPQQSAEEALSIRGQLKADLARVRAELAQARAYMAPTAPKVVALQQQAASLDAQISNESRRLVNPSGERGLNESIASFEDAMIEKEFAQGAYQSALTSLELARSEAVRQHRYLARVAQPSTPDEATYPKRILGTLTVLILSLALVGISSLLLEAIREHAKI